ncbi:MAG TPA: extracellular solute-binding protein [Chloroflexota bacterium]|jgi:multiple sugar transport system substrate-binding protein|nr:extracellular solute-binding protein [Chloroflexota bacterium]
MKDVSRTRRAFILGATTVAGGAAALACAPAGGAPPARGTAPVSGTIAFWHAHGTSGDQYEWMARWASSFEQAAAPAKVEVTGIGLFDIGAKFGTAVAGGSAPDLIAGLGRGTVPNRARLKQTQSLQDRVKRDGLDLNQFWKSTIEETTWQGQLYALPYNGTVVVHYWNKALFREVGLDPERPAQTWDQLWDYAGRIDLRGGDGKWARVGFYPLPGSFNWFLSWAWSNGAQFVAGQGGERKPQLNNPAAVETLEHWVRYARKYTPEGWTEFVGALGSQPGQDAFTLNRLGAVHNGSQWVRGVYGRVRELDFGVSTLPARGTRATLAAGGGLEIPAGAQNAEGAWALAKHLLRPECQQEQVLTFSAVPGTRAGLDAAELRGDARWRAVDQAMASSRYVEWVEGVANWRNNVERHVAEAMKLNEAPREALDKAQAEVDQELAGYRASR